MTQGAVGTPVADETIAVAKTACGVAMQCSPGTTVIKWGRSPMALRTGCRLMADTARAGIEACNRSVGADPEERSVAAWRPRAMAMQAAGSAVTGRTSARCDA